MIKQTIIYLTLIILLTAGLIYENQQVNILRSRLRTIDTLYISRVITDTIFVKSEIKKAKNYVQKIKKDSAFVTEFNFKDKRIEITGKTFWQRDSANYSLNYTLYPDTIGNVLHYRNNQILNTVDFNGKQYEAETKADYFSELTKEEKPAFWDNIYVGFLAGVAMTTAIYYTARGK